MPILTDGVITLRPPRAEDIDAIYAACQDPEIQPWTTCRRRTIANTRWLTSSASRHEPTTAAFLAFDGDELVGSFGVMEIDRERAYAEIGYWVAAPARGRGVASRGVTILRDWAAEGKLGVQPGRAAHPRGQPAVEAGRRADRLPRHRRAARRPRALRSPGRPTTTSTPGLPSSSSARRCSRAAAKACARPPSGSTRSGPRDPDEQPARRGELPGPEEPGGRQAGRIARHTQPAATNPATPRSAAALARDREAADHQHDQPQPPPLEATANSHRVSAYMTTSITT